MPANIHTLSFEKMCISSIFSFEKMQTDAIFKMKTGDLEI